MNKYAIRRSTLALTIGSALATGATHAATITVDTAQDGAVGSVAGCSLREAIASANNGNSQGGCAAGSPGADTIEFDPSLAESTITLNAGELAVTDSLAINGPVAGDADGLIIDGDNLFRIFDAAGPLEEEPIDFTLDSMTLTRARVTGQGARGGAVFSLYANVNLQSVSLINNSASADAVGPLSNERGGTANALAGGAGVFLSLGDLSLTDCLIIGNSVNSGASGDDALSRAIGAAVVVEYGELFITGSQFSDNHATATVEGPQGRSVSAGPIVAFGSNVTVTNSLIDDNHSQSSATLSTDTGSSVAGGLYIGNSDLLMTQTTISSNRLVSPDLGVGGALVVFRSDADVRNSTLSGNLVENGTGSAGGAAYVRGFEDTNGTDHVPASLTLLHSTLAFNSATNGADGIDAVNNAQTYFHLTNSLIAQNKAADIACSRDATSHSLSLVSDVSCTGTATTTADLKLTGLSNFGGFTPTHGLLPNSVAIDAAGDCSADHAVTNDQRGQLRPGIGSANCDVGALEVQENDNFDSIFQDRFEQN